MTDYPVYYVHPSELDFPEDYRMVYRVLADGAHPEFSGRDDRWFRSGYLHEDELIDDGFVNRDLL